MGKFLQEDCRSLAASLNTLEAASSATLLQLGRKVSIPEPPPLAHHPPSGGSQALLFVGGHGAPRCLACHRHSFQLRNCRLCRSHTAGSLCSSAPLLPPQCQAAAISHLCLQVSVEPLVPAFSPLQNLMPLSTNFKLWGTLTMHIPQISFLPEGQLLHVPPKPLNKPREELNE